MTKQTRSDRLAHQIAQKLSHEPDIGFCIITLDASGKEGTQATCLTNIPPAILTPILQERADTFSDGGIGQVFYQQKKTHQ